MFGYDVAPPLRYDADLRAAKEELAKEKEALAAEHAALQDKVKVHALYVHVHTHTHTHHLKCVSLLPVICICRL